MASQILVPDQSQLPLHMLTTLAWVLEKCRSARENIGGRDEI